MSTVVGPNMSCVFCALGSISYFEGGNKALGPGFPERGGRISGLEQVRLEE